jgi:hypothetical protein
MSKALQVKFDLDWTCMYLVGDVIKIKRRCFGYGRKKQR